MIETLTILSAFITIALGLPQIYFRVRALLARGVDHENEASSEFRAYIRQTISSQTAIFEEDKIELKGTIEYQLDRALAGMPASYRKRALSNSISLWYDPVLIAIFFPFFSLILLYGTFLTWDERPWNELLFVISVAALYGAGAASYIKTILPVLRFKALLLELNIKAERRLVFKSRRVDSIRENLIGYEKKITRRIWIKRCKQIGIYGGAAYSFLDNLFSDGWIRILKDNDFESFSYGVGYFIVYFGLPAILWALIGLCIGWAMGRVGVVLIKKQAL